MDDTALEKLWEAFGDVPIDEDEQIDIDFDVWPKGTHIEEIWAWFDEKHSKGVVYLMFKEGKMKHQIIEVVAKDAFETAKADWEQAVANGQRTECLIESTDIFGALSDNGQECSDANEEAVEEALMELGYYTEAAEAFKKYTKGGKDEN